MEMLGKELLCPEESFEDDDTLSVESFPELPNTEELSEFFSAKIIQSLFFLSLFFEIREISFWIILYQFIREALYNGKLERIIFY